ncbi:uncharacterized protein LOC134667438 [Cydia fagiglandana]|uniref:uncharacterized protein LOC134667438 n=1 Tax=Cydia fagiglandana TaxID=1458189 RepID=UPI002FEE0807
MANIESTDALQSKHMTFSNSKVPVIGCFIDYLDIGVNYLYNRSLRGAKLQPISGARPTLSPAFLACVCLLLGLIANVKLEVVKFDETPLSYDLHFMLMSKENNLYIDDIDTSRVMWCIEASDCAALLISCLLIWNSSNVKASLAEYMFLPWLGVTVRGMILRQLPTVAALVYTMSTVDSHVNPMFLAGFSFLFLLQARICLEIIRALRARWLRRALSSDQGRVQVETLWSSEEDDVPSVEMRNFLY